MHPGAARKPPLGSLLAAAAGVCACMAGHGEPETMAVSSCADQAPTTRGMVLPCRGDSGYHPWNLGTDGGNKAHLL